MKLVDARSGRVVNVPTSKITYFNPPLLYDYGDGTTQTIYSVEPGLFKAYATVQVTSPSGTSSGRWPLQVRWLHPGFPLQHVAFIPS